MTAGTESSSAKSKANDSNPHVLWRQLVGLVLWIGVFGFLIAEAAVIWFLALGALTFTDAWVSRIYKDPSRKSIFNISPMTWGIAMALLPIVTYPAYLINRNKLRTRQAKNGYFVATIVLGALMTVLYAYELYWQVLIALSEI